MGYIQRLLMGYIQRLLMGCCVPAAQPGRSTKRSSYDCHNSLGQLAGHVRVAAPNQLQHYYGPSSQRRATHSCLDSRTAAGAATSAA